jgi:very-short-patch-repair endonuclease
MQRASTKDARRLRSNATPAEALLWKHLRNRYAASFKFRRQHDLGRYVAEFYCAEAGVVIEIDGGIHKERKPFDAARTLWLEAQGLKVMRLSNAAVMRNPSGAVAAIVARCQARLRSPT